MNQVFKRRGIHTCREFNKNGYYSEDDFHHIRVNEDSDLSISESKASEECSECEELFDNINEQASDSSDSNYSPSKNIKNTHILPKIRDSQEQSGIMKYLWIFFVCIIVISSISYFAVIARNNIITKSDCDKIPSCTFQKYYKQLQTDFQNQNKWSWKVIRTAVNSIINSTRHNQPAVILFVASKRADIISSCLANRLANGLEESYNNLNGYSKVNRIEGISDLEMKEKIDTAFKESFENNNNHVIVLERLDTYSAETAMILHSYCDHENAPYKDVVIIMTINTNTSIANNELSLKKMDLIAWQHLDNIWETQMDEGKRAALLTRITTSVALIVPEDNIPQLCMEYATH